MNRVTTSVGGTLLAGGAGAVAAWLAAKNLLPTADVSMATTVFGDLAMGVGLFALAWLKGLMVTKAATLAAASQHIADGTAVVVPGAQTSNVTGTAVPLVVPVKGK